MTNVEDYKKSKIYKKLLDAGIIRASIQESTQLNAMALDIWRFEQDQLRHESLLEVNKQFLEINKSITKMNERMSKNIEAFAKAIEKLAKSVEKK